MRSMAGRPLKGHAPPIACIPPRDRLDTTVTGLRGGGGSGSRDCATWAGRLSPMSFPGVILLELARRLRVCQVQPPTTHLAARGETTASFRNKHLPFYSANSARSRVTRDL
jgi:hypothetical protein